MSSAQASTMASEAVSLREWQLRKPYASDSVTVRSLSHVLTVGADIWGRQKPQPVQLTIKIGLAQPFASAAASDSVDTSTVHYGDLSKSVFALCEKFEREGTGSILNLGRVIMSGILDSRADRIAYMELDIYLPKATRYGVGVETSLKLTRQPQLASSSLTIHRLAVPCIIGVNAHERGLKQMVKATVSIDRPGSALIEAFYELEQLVVKTIEESAYETLEALAEEVASNVIKHRVWAPAIGSAVEPEAVGVRVALEKPSAVPFADAPIIDIFRTCQRDDALVQRLLAELGNKPLRIPFPLPGRLDEFLRSSKQD